MESLQPLNHCGLCPKKPEQMNLAIFWRCREFSQKMVWLKLKAKEV